MKDTREIMPRRVAERVELERPFEAQMPQPNGGYGYRNFEQQEGLQLGDYWRAIRKRLWLVIGIAVLLTTLAAIYMARKPDIFMSKAMVQIDLEQPNQDLQLNDRPNRGSNPDPAYFNTQLQLLNSDSLLRRVVKELSLDSNKEIQQMKGEQGVSAWKSLLKSIGLASDDKKKNEKAVGEVAPSQTSEIASNDDIAEAVRLAPYVKILKDSLGVEPVRESRATNIDTRLIEISFQNKNPELAANIVNGIAIVFTKQNQEKRSGNSKSSNEFLDSRISSLKADIRNDEIKLERLKRESGILTLKDEETLALNALSQLNKNLLDAQNIRKNAEAEYNSVRNSPDSIKARAEQLMARYITERENDLRNFESKAQENLYNLKAQKEQLLKEYQQQAQEVREVDSKIEVIENAVSKRRNEIQKDLENYRTRVSQNIVDDLRTKYLQAKETEDKIQSSFDQERGKAEGQNQAAISIRLLEQNMTTNRGFLENLMKQQSGNTLLAQGTENNISVTEIAIPSETAVSPRRVSTVLAALFLSTLFGAGLALFLEYLDDTVRSTEEVESLLQLPALAAIPAIDSTQKRRLLLVGSTEDTDSKKGSSLLIHQDSRSSLAEAYRQLRTSILLSTAGHAPKSLLVTSSLPAEGKTTTAVNTAISLAQTGAKVLIIDADMRRPRLHSVFEISNAQGLSTMLSSELSEDEMLDIIQYDESAKLHLLPSGPVPPNPAELIGSEQMAFLLKSMQGQFTHVVVDSPPIASFTDGVLIASMVDGVILVVHSGKSSRQVIKRSRQLLQDIGAKIFGVVLNNVNLRSQDNYYYYQSYYHRSNYNTDDEE